MDINQHQLRIAWQQVKRGSRIAGIDGITVDWFASIYNDKLQQLHQQLRNDSYFPLPAKGFFLRKNNGGKRLVGISTVRDRIVQRWLLGELYLPLEDYFLDCSYAYRPGRGIKQSAWHYFELYQTQPTWTVKADIAQFFDHLCHGILRTALDGLDLEDHCAEAVMQQVEAGISIQGILTRPTQGVVQGNILSGALANLYLTEFDRRCIESGYRLVRYGDDLVLACDSLAEADRVLSHLEDWLKQLYLTLQPEKTHIFAPDEPFTFLSYRFEDGTLTEPPPPQLKHGLARPYGATPKRRPARPPSRPPRACSLKPSVPQGSTAPPAHYFAEPMTTLYVTDQGAYLKVKHYQFQVFFQHQLQMQVPVNRVTHIVLFGCCNLSHGAVRLALTRGISVTYLSNQGRYFGRLNRQGTAKVEYLARQVERAADGDFVRTQAEAIVRAKLHNSRVLLLRLNRRRQTPEATEAIHLLERLLENLPLADSIEALLGYEGKGASMYFRGFGSLLKEQFQFEKRNKRPPKDPANSLMSLGYTLLSYNVYAFVEAIGLHPHFGNLHVTLDYRPGLVCDLMEEFRSPLVDSFVAYLVNSSVLQLDDFTPPDDRGGVYLHPDARRKFVKHWEDKLQTEMTHLTTGYRVTYRRCIELQVREYLACLLGDVEAYRPMLRPLK
ncbi:CRISPR-associated endonuclease Cas1 [Baaleninema sp.]|uniref:CRISPR-associated endonuclease Cas1 n=1 Tax=Baaleninema sp. TaxID=3101197 RepID=UPI003D00CDCD